MFIVAKLFAIFASYNSEFVCLLTRGVKIFVFYTVGKSSIFLINSYNRDQDYDLTPISLEPYIVLRDFYLNFLCLLNEE